MIGNKGYGLGEGYIIRKGKVKDLGIKEREGLGDM